MTSNGPVAELDAPFSDEGATATSWQQAREALERAEVFWVTTVRADGRPHVTPLVAVWLDDALYFCTGDREQKAKNLERNVHCILTTGCNAFREGLDIVVEGDAVTVTNDAMLQRLADAWKSKFDWPFDVRDGAFRHEGGGGRVPVFEVAPKWVFAYARGEKYCATRYRFPGKAK